MGFFKGLGKGIGKALGTATKFTPMRLTPLGAPLHAASQLLEGENLKNSLKAGGRVGLQNAAGAAVLGAGALGAGAGGAGAQGLFSSLGKLPWKGIGQAVQLGSEAYGGYQEGKTNDRVLRIQEQQIKRQQEEEERERKRKEEVWRLVSPMFEEWFNKQGMPR